MNTEHDVAADAIARLSEDLRAAMRLRDKAATRAIRRLMAAISNAEAVEQPTDLPPQVVNPGDPVVAARSDVPRAKLSSADLRRIVDEEIDDLASAVAEYTNLGLADQAAALQAEHDVLDHYRAGRTPVTETL